MSDDRITNQINCLAEVLNLSEDDVVALKLIAAKLEGSANSAQLISTALDILVANNIRNNQLVETIFSGRVNNTTSESFAIPQGQYMAILCDGTLTINQYLDANDTWQAMNNTIEPGEQMKCVGSKATITTVTDVYVTIVRSIESE